MKRTWRTCACPAFLVLLGLGFALVPLAKGEIFFYWDNAQQHYVQTGFLHRALRAGSLPQWWPDVGLGVPTVAEGQAAHYSPLCLLFALLFPPPVAFMGEIAVYMAVAGLSTYYYLRAFRLHRAACLIGGLCQMFGSFSVVSVNNIALLRSLCLLPLAMFAAERFVTRRGLTYGLAASLILGLQFLTGYPMVAIITIVATAVYILCRMLQHAWHRQASLQWTVWQLVRVGVQWGLVIMLGVGLAAMQFLPILLHVEQSVRQGGLNFHYAAKTLAVKARYLPQLLFPYVYSQGEWLQTMTASGRYGNEVPYMGLYVGAFPVLLTILGLWWYRRWPHPAGSLVVCGGIALGLAFGDKTPLFPALWSLPGMHGVRYPGRFLMWLSFCLASLAAFGCHSLLARSRLPRHRTRDSMPFVLLAVGVLLGALFFWRYGTTLAKGTNIAPDFRSGIVVSLALFGVALSLGWGFLMRWRRQQGVLLALAVLFVLADLTYFRGRSGYAPAVPLQDVMTPPPVGQFLQTDPEPFRVMSLIPMRQHLNRNEDLFEFMQANVTALWGIASADVFFSLFEKRYWALHDAILWELTHSPAAAEQLAGFLGALNVKYVVAPRSITLHGWEQVYQTERASTWRNPACLPPVFLVGNVVPEQLEIRPEWFLKATHERLPRYYEMVSNWSTRIEDAELIDNIMASPRDYRTTAVVAAQHLPTLGDFDPASAVRAGPHQSDVMRFAVQSRQPALLVLAHSYYPGWTATVNDQATQLYRTNYVGMGVVVPAGSSEVVLHFATPGLRVGTWVTIAALGLLCGGWGLAWKRQAASVWDLFQPDERRLRKPHKVSVS